jgi:SLT domain-containing protein
MANPFDFALEQEGVTGPLAELARSIYMQESGGGKNTTTSNAGAVGGMQIIPATFARMADEGWDINNPEQNARAGLRYIKRLHEMSGGDPMLTAAGYYGGEGAIEKARQGIAISDPRNPNAPNTLQYGRQVADRLASATTSDVNPPTVSTNPFAALNEEFRLGVPEPKQQANPFDSLNTEFALPKAAPYVAPAAPKERTTGETIDALKQDLKRQAGLTTRYGMEGLGDVGSIIVSPFQVPMNAASRALGGPPVANMREIATNVANAMGLPQPQGRLENIVGEVSRGMAPASATARLASLLSRQLATAAPIKAAELATQPVTAAVAPTITQKVTEKLAEVPVQKVLEQLAQSPVLQTIAGGTASGAGGAAKAFGGGPASELGATVAGALAPGGATAAATKGYKIGQAAIQPLYEGGRNQIMANALRNVIPEDRVADIVEKLTAAKSLVPGSMPTAAEVAESGGLASFARAANAAYPEPSTQRGLEQNAARLQAARSVAGDEASLAAAEQARKSTTGPLYRQAEQSTAQVDTTRTVDLIDRLSAKNSGRPQLVNALQQVRETLFENDALRSKPENIISSIGGIKDILQTTENTLIKRELLTVKRSLENQLKKVEPSFRQAERQYAELSQPINQMQIGQDLLNKLQPALADYGALGSETAAKYAQALRNSDQTAKLATGFKGATLERTMTPEQMGTLTSIAQDLARKANAQNLGRGVGSDTFQKISMANMAQQVGMPIGLVESLGKVPAIGGYLTRIYGEADTQMQQALAKVLLDPQATAKLIAQANPGDRSRLMADALRGTLTPSSFMNQ